MLPAKALLQDLCRQNLGWDDTIPDKDEARWRNWLEDLHKLEQLKVDCCFNPCGFGEALSCQLHHFADASQLTYGAVTYLRLTNSNGDTHCSFIIGKSRLSPLKQLTILRLQLSAAVVATRLDRMVRKEIGTPINDSIFWTDSTCVLGYIGNDDKRFHTFVANSVAAIQEASSPSQWRHVNGKQNPADDASRGLAAEALLKSERWIISLSFLWYLEATWSWPETAALAIADNDPEVKNRSQVFSTSTADDGGVTVNQVFEHFS